MRKTRLKSRGKDYEKKQAEKARKQRELESSYGVKLSYRRYQGRKGIYWYLLSQYVRMRDFKAYGTCISCGKKFNKWQDAQGGHYAPAGDCGFDLVFDEKNVHAECSSCNNPRFSPGKLIPYRANLVERYGEEFTKDLDERYRLAKTGHTTKAWTQKEYDVKIRELQERIKELENEAN